MYTTFCNTTPLPFSCVRLPSPRQPKHRVTFCHRLCLRQKTDTQDQTHAEDRHGELIIAGGEKKKKKEEGNWRRWEKLYNSSVMLQPGLVVRLCKWEAPSSIAALDLFTMGMAYNGSSKLIKACGFCMWPCRWRRAWEKRSLQQLLCDYCFLFVIRVELLGLPWNCMISLCLSRETNCSQDMVRQISWERGRPINNSNI